MFLEDLFITGKLVMSFVEELKLVAPSLIKNTLVEIPTTTMTVELDQEK